MDHKGSSLGTLFDRESGPSPLTTRSVERNCACSPSVYHPNVGMGSIPLGGCGRFGTGYPSQPFQLPLFTAGGNVLNWNSSIVGLPSPSEMAPMGRAPAGDNGMAHSLVHSGYDTCLQRGQKRNELYTSCTDGLFYPTGTSDRLGSNADSQGRWEIPPVQGSIPRRLTGKEWPPSQVRGNCISSMTSDSGTGF